MALHMLFTRFLKYWMCLGLSKDEWKSAAEKLLAYGQHPRTVIKVLHDEEDFIDLLYIQLDCQRELFKKYGQLVQMDGTYKTNRTGMPLYTLLVEDNYGVGQPVCYFFVKEETTDALMSGLEIFTAV